MEIIGVIGLPGSGKTEISNCAKDRGIPVIIMGDIIRKECLSRGLDPSSDHGSVAKNLREEMGADVVAKLATPLVQAAIKENEVILIDGIRSEEEIGFFRREFKSEFKLIRIECPFEIRLERIKNRNRDNQNVETLEQRDERESIFGVVRAMERADIKINNNGTLEELQLKFLDMIK
jgi:dephospho-CoA kinase